MTGRDDGHTLSRRIILRFPHHGGPALCGKTNGGDDEFGSFASCKAAAAAVTGYRKSRKMGHKCLVFYTNRAVFADSNHNYPHN